jgi:hypothetical protein
MPPIRLSDSELDAVIAAARPLAVEMRDPFLHAVAHALSGRRHWPRHRASDLPQAAAAVLRPAGSDPPVASGGLGQAGRRRRAVAVGSRRHSASPLVARA